MMNEALREYLGKSSRSIDEDTLRRVIREELKATGQLHFVCSLPGVYHLLLIETPLANLNQLMQTSNTS